MRFADFPRRTQMRRVRVTLCKNRHVWAVAHKQGTSLIKARNGPQAIRRATELLGLSLGPYIVLKNQDQEVACAMIEGAKIL